MVQNTRNKTPTPTHKQQTTPHTIHIQFVFIRFPTVDILDPESLVYEEEKEEDEEEENGMVEDEYTNIYLIFKSTRHQWVVL